jgi:hypothetical protein
MHLLKAFFASALLSCGGKAEPTTPIGISNPTPEAKAQFAFDSLDARPVSSESIKGKVAVLVFVTTYDWASQAEVDFVVPIAKHDDPKVTFALVALQSRSDRELVEHYCETLNVTFPTALADVPSASAAGFGEVRSVPTLIVVDANGKMVFRKEGIVKGDEIRRVIDVAKR